MNPKNIGKAIASLRKKAGYTQATMAEILGISDKAVSKWERGVACPDVSLFPKLSILLDTDIDDLINGEIIERNHNWKGVLFLDELASIPVFTKPLVYFLLQNFMLVGIRDILVLGGNVQDILGTGERWGIRLTYDSNSSPSSLLEHPSFVSTSTMLMYSNALIYGANLTRKYQCMMLFENSVVELVTDSQRQVPICFCHEFVWDRMKHRIAAWTDTNAMLSDFKPDHKALTRGMTVLPLLNTDQILAASIFVQIVEQSDGREIANLDEIAENRSLTRLKSFNR